jgi:hypothetical protein
VHPGVANAEQPRKIATLPAHRRVDPRIERPSDGTNLAEWDRRQPPVLDAEDDLARDPSTIRQVRLAPPLLDPDDAQHGSDPLVVHRSASLTRAAYLSLTPELWRGAAR